MKIFIVYSNENMSIDSIYSNYESAQKRCEKLCQSSSTKYTTCYYNVVENTNNKYYIVVERDLTTLNYDCIGAVYSDKEKAKKYVKKRQSLYPNYVHYVRCFKIRQKAKDF